MAWPRGAYNLDPMAQAGILGFGLDSCVAGRFAPPGSKSLAQRALLAGAVALGRTRIEGLSEAEDVRAALGVLETLGGRCARPTPTSGELEGVPPGPVDGRTPRAALRVGESGTLARLTTALVALATRPGERWTIVARGSLLFRRSPPLFETLRAAGVRFERQNLPGTWPVELVSVTPPVVLHLEEPVSSQEVSGLLLALASHPEERSLFIRGPIPSAPYLAMTIGLLQKFGARIERERQGEERTIFRVAGPLRAPESPLVIEPDASSAAVALAAACLSGGELLVPGLGATSPQGDLRIVEHLQAFGCEARIAAEGLFARGFPSRGAELNLVGEPDLAPVLAAVAAGAALRHGATSRIAGLGTLPGKESDRMSVLARGLEALGVGVEAGTDWLRVGPCPAGGKSRGETLALDPAGDHRMAFAFALLGLLVPRVFVRDPGCVAKSWGSFWEDLAGLGATLQEG